MAGVSIDYGTVQVFDEALPPDLFDEICKIAPRLGWLFGWRSKDPKARYWHFEVIAGEKHNTVDLTENARKHPIKVFSRYVDWLRSEVVPADTRLLRLYLNAHTFGTDGSVHTDTDRTDELTVVLFVNREWNPDFGGETAVFDDAGEIEKSVLPRANRLLTFPSDRLHGPRPLSKLFGGLRIVLVAKLGVGPEGWVRK